jgi:hypothetical protein
VGRRYAVLPSNQILPKTVIWSLFDSNALSMTASSVIYAIPRQSYNFNGENIPQNFDDSRAARSHRLTTLSSTRSEALMSCRAVRLSIINPTDHSENPSSDQEHYFL